ncbi:hypothetical protein VL806_07885 [Listeria seeligeri]|uniref:hypothetical protein n=1 Tax=Listeria seeligeri TaxID=1640 RepID=UPI0018B053AC|nr:hypothetical protein [Listeria seeligeri]QPJ26875.1 hypothetical protein IMX23_01575 [Listeria seeligeri]
MKIVTKVINQISFEEAEKRIDEESIQAGISGKENTLMSYFLKKILIFISAFIVPIIFFSVMTSYDMNQIAKGGRYLFLTIIFIFIMIVLLNIYVYVRIYWKMNFSYLNQFNFRLLTFLLLEISVVGYSSITILGSLNKYSPFLVVSILVLYYVIVYKLVEVILSTQVYEEFNRNYGLQLQVKKWKQLLSRFPIVLFIIMIIGMQGYRLSKSFFIFTHRDTPLTILYSFIGDLGAVLIAICVALLPTIVFNSKIFVRGALLKKYTEKFREKYKATDKEWYGEK